MDYSIVIPVFNRAELTRGCLQSLAATLPENVDGEVLVVDNGSTDATQAVLAEFEWVRILRNQENRGFAAAVNQGARAASGEYLILLNNDMIARPGWLDALLRRGREPGVGAVGARLLYPGGTIQHAGVVMNCERLSASGFVPTHRCYGFSGDSAAAARTIDLQAVTGACLLTPRAIFERAGGLDEAYWNGYEDVDYCLALRERGLRIVYEPSACLTHFESKSGPERFRRVPWNTARLADKWNGHVRFDANAVAIADGGIVRSVRTSRGNVVRQTSTVPVTTVVVHGDPDRRGDRAFMQRLRAHACPVGEVIILPGSGAKVIEPMRQIMEVRGDRFLALVSAAAELEPGWLEELVRQVTFAPAIGAATYAPELPLGENVGSLSADARCTLLHLQKFPAHLRLGDFETLDGAVADFLIRGVEARVGTRGAARPLARLPDLARDASFRAVHGFDVQASLSPDASLVERRLRAAAGRRRGLVSVVMLSWNAVQFTKLALQSIREHTAGDYEVIIVDNGSNAETVEWLRSLDGVRVLYNESNRGYAGGNNQAMAAARGEYVVLLNNDVIVTHGWLEGLLHAFDRIPALGVSAVRSNKIAGDQLVAEAEYAGLDGLHEYARARRERYRDQGYVTDRAIGLCLCIDRRVIEEIGGIDERFGVGNFEDDDFCLRVRAAGYRIFVCDDVFIHHFGSQTFAANKVDWNATMRENWQKFALKWELPTTQEGGGYQPRPAIDRGFIRSKHYVPLPSGEAPASHRPYRLVFLCPVRTEEEWNDTAVFARRYVRAFTREHDVLLTIAAFGGPVAEALGARVERLVRREGLDPETIADVEISDEDDEAAWRARYGSAAVEISTIDRRNPSALRRRLQAVP